MSLEPPSTGPRLDKWLWSIRLFKTRTLAAAACQAGQVRIHGQRVKPSRTIRTGEIVEVRLGEITRTVRIRQPLDHRVGARLVPEFIEDLTPPEEHQKSREKKVSPLFQRPRGAGRPTKKDRRRLDSLEV